MGLLSGSRAEALATVKDAAEKAGTLTVAALAIAAVALLVSGVALVVAMKVGKNAGSSR